jgi:hypothetical protein
MSDTSNPIRPKGSNVTLTCTVKLNNYSIANLSTILVNASFSKNNASLTLPSLEMMVDNTTFMYTTQLNLFQRNDSGNYNCTVIVSPRSRLNYTVNSTITKIIKVSTGYNNDLVLRNYMYTIFTCRCLSLLKSNLNR